MVASELPRTDLTKSRRHIVFAWSVFIAALVITNFCLSPVLYPRQLPTAIFQDPGQEALFVDVFAIAGAAWLTCWVSLINGWRYAAKTGQWLGIVLLCLNQVLFIEMWVDVVQSHNALAAGIWAVPWLLQAYLVSCFVGFFTMPTLTAEGNRALTGLGTLAMILPWLVGRKEILVGAQVLNSEILHWSKVLGS